MKMERSASQISTEVASPATRSSHSASYGQAALRARESQPSRRVALRRVLSDRGWDPDVVEGVIHGKRSSTLGVYDSKWKLFTEWCDVHDHSPFMCEPKDIALYLWSLFDSGRQPSTIKGHRCTIANTYKVAEVYWDPGSNYHLSELVKFFDRQRPRSQSIVPKWDLAVVLHYLRSDVFEPLAESSLEYLTYKMVFFIALASASRVSELYALSRQDDFIVWHEDGDVH